MNARFCNIIVRTAGWSVFAAAVLWPMICLVARCVLDGRPPEDGFLISLRQWGLLLRSLGLAAAGTICCLLLSLPCTYVLARKGGLGRQPEWAAALLLLLLLLCPPMVYAFGWSRILPVAIHEYVRCVGVWASWGWPIPAALIATDWLRTGRDSFEDALLVTTPARAFILVAVPALRRSIVLAALIVFVLFLGDYAVPHACGLTVYATELLVWSSNSVYPIDTLWPATPVLILMSCTLVLIARLFRGFSTAETRRNDVPREVLRSFFADPLAWAAVGCFLASWALPLAVLLFSLSSMQAIPRAFTTYSADVAWSLVTSVTAGILVVLMGISLTAVVPLRRMGLWGSLMLGAVPGAVVGVSLLSAFNRSGLEWVYDHWSIVTLSCVARFGWMGVLACELLYRGQGQELIEQAQLDGTTRSAAFLQILVPANRPLLFGVCAVVALLSLQEVASTSLVRPPSFTPIAHVMIEKFHRFEDDMLISLSTGLNLAAIVVVVSFGWAIRKGRDRYGFRLLC